MAIYIGFYHKSMYIFKVLVRLWPLPLGSGGSFAVMATPSTINVSSAESGGCRGRGKARKLGDGGGGW